MNLTDYLTKPITPTMIAVIITIIILVIGRDITKSLNYQERRQFGYTVQMTASFIGLVLIVIGFSVSEILLSKQLADDVSTNVFNGEQINVVGDANDDELIIEYEGKLYEIEYKDLNDGRKLYKKNEVDVDDESITIGD